MKWKRLLLFISRLRRRLFLSVAGILLGKKSASMIVGDHLRDYMASGIQFPNVENHLRCVETINDAEIVTYKYPKEHPAYFPKKTAFDSKCAYHLSNVRVLPKSGAVCLDDGTLLEESAMAYDIYMQCGVVEGMLPSRDMETDAPIFPFATCYAYYHELVEVLLAALQARDRCPDIKMLLHPDHPSYIDQMLDFFGFGNNDIILSPMPVTIKNCIMIPYVHQRSFLSASDAGYLRKAVHERLNKDIIPSGRIYISRRKAKSRSLENERYLEELLQEKGVIPVVFEEMPFAKQLETVFGAQTIVAPHGSGLANIVAARPATRIVEIVSPEWRRSTFARLSSELDLDYRFLSAERGNHGYFAPIDTILGIV